MSWILDKVEEMRNYVSRYVEYWMNDTEPDHEMVKTFAKHFVSFFFYFQAAAAPTDQLTKQLTGDVIY